MHKISSLIIFIFNKDIQYRVRLIKRLIILYNIVLLLSMSRIGIKKSLNEYLGIFDNFFIIK